MRLWIDTDIALGATRGDVDDGFALAAILRHALASPDRIELLGISCVAGNTDAASVEAAARAFMDRYQGTAVACTPIVDMADATDALQAIEGDFTLLALGPPTNLVNAAAADPSWPERVEARAVGTLLTDGWNPILSRFCLNFRRDPAASKAFFKLPFARRVLYPIDVLWPFRFDRRDLDRIAKQGPIGRFLADGSRRWLRQAPLRYLRRGFPVWDLVAALDTIGALDDPHHRETKPARGTLPRSVLAGFDLESTLAKLAFEVQGAS